MNNYKSKPDGIKFSLVGTRRCERCSILYANEQSYSDHILTCERVLEKRGAFPVATFMRRVGKCKRQELLNTRRGTMCGEVL